ncbi:MAG: hypothetical protein ACTS6J_18700 [Burkholderiales bacterium]
MLPQYELAVVVETRVNVDVPQLHELEVCLPRQGAFFIVPVFERRIDSVTNMRELVQQDIFVLG